MHILFLVFSDLTKSDKATGLEGLVKIIGEDAFLIEYLDPLATLLVYDFGSVSRKISNTQP